jgi:hypothetical protein
VQIGVAEATGLPMPTISCQTVQKYHLADRRWHFVMASIRQLVVEMCFSAPFLKSTVKDTAAKKSVACTTAPIFPYPGARHPSCDDHAHQQQTYCLQHPFELKGVDRVLPPGDRRAAYRPRWLHLVVDDRRTWNDRVNWRDRQLKHPLVVGRPLDGTRAACDDSP